MNFKAKLAIAMIKQSHFLVYPLCTIVTQRQNT